MKGLLLKDIYTLNATLKIYAVMTIAYRVIGVTTENMSFLYIAFVLASTVVPMSAVAYDERCTWGRYSSILPVSRTQLAISKYILGLVCLVFCVLSAFVAFLFSDSMVFAEFLATAVSTTGIAIIYMSLAIPVMYKLGAEKSRMLIFVILLVPAGLILGTAYLITEFGFEIPPAILSLLSNDNALLAAIILFSLTLLAASMAISVSIYKKKDF